MPETVTSACSLNHAGLISATVSPPLLHVGTYGRGWFDRQLDTSLNHVAGKITLQDVVNSAQTITMEFRPVDGTEPFDRTTTLDASGKYMIDNIPAKKYVVHIKGRKWLARNIVVDATSGNVDNAHALLRAGDVNDSSASFNAVDLDDLGDLANAFNTAPGDSLWNASADLNCDGSVDITDLGLLALNFNAVGDN